MPSISIAICTRDRTGDLEKCLGAMAGMDYPDLEVLVIDNAPGSDATQQLVQERFPEFRYIREPRPGLDWARNRAIVEARGEVIAFTDDDVLPDPLWAYVIGATFAEEPEAAAITGLVAPYELESPAQEYFEMRGGFGKGFSRRWFHGAPPGRRLPWHILGTGNCGTGANMAFRRSVFEQVGGFDPALDVGTPTRGAGDLEMFFRILKEGFHLLYEPAAIVRHRHRQDLEALHRQIFDNGSVFAYIRRSMEAYPDQRRQFIRLGSTWFFKDLVRRWIRARVIPMRYPKSLRTAEILGCLRGLKTYPVSRANARRIEEQYGPLGPEINKQPRSLPNATRVGVRCVELSQPLQPFEDLEEFTSVRVYAMWKGSPLGFCNICCQGHRVSVRHLAEALTTALGMSLYEPGVDLSNSQRRTLMSSAIRRRLVAVEEPVPEKLSDSVQVSVIVGTFDRPDALRRCLQCLKAQVTSRPLQLIVTDNRPSSGITPKVMEEFPEVLLVEEPRQGVAYARNAGFLACQGEIIVTTDDDVTMPNDWLEKLVAPFSRADIMLVNGNILPEELETPSQRMFESYGGLGRGFETRDFDGNWFERLSRQAVPTWNLGATANCAFRASALRHPEIGLLDEALGPGMPSGVGEDIYLYYKVLKAGFTVRYAPDAYVWHTHRRSITELRRQLYNYSKGFVSYHLTTLCRDRDLRALFTLLVHLPKYHWSRIKSCMRGRGRYPLSITFVEIKGNLMGPVALWQSIRRVRREGRSGTAPPSGGTPGVKPALNGTAAVCQPQLNVE
ncbi:MAG: glycosyltransferase [Verrucomicrobiaceae bacterium]|nr:MAG: glycosyltransferase [Verrucomicrobiaceae bacterium]